MRKQMHMSPEIRAKQFMPFAALRGYEQAVKEKQIVLLPKKELTEEYKVELDYKLHCLKPDDEVVIIYYQGGCYRQRTGKIKMTDPFFRYVRIGGLEISTADIFDIVLKNGD